MRRDYQDSLPRLRPLVCHGILLTSVPSGGNANDPGSLPDMTTYFRQADVNLT
jgi:hypothetical protein